MWWLVLLRFLWIQKTNHQKCKKWVKKGKIQHTLQTLKENVLILAKIMPFIHAVVLHKQTVLNSFFKLVLKIGFKN